MRPIPKLLVRHTNRQADGEARPAAVPILRGQFAAMRFDESSGDGQPEARDPQFCDRRRDRIFQRPAPPIPAEALVRDR